VNDAAYQGFDLEVVARPISQWSARLAVGSLNAAYENFLTNPTIVGLLDKSPKHTPEWTVDLSTEYTFTDLPGVGGDLAIGGSYSYVTLTFECLNHIPTCQQEPYGLVNAHLAYTLPDDRFQIVLAGTNIANEAYFKIAASGGPSRYYSAPAEWSVALKARF
jgi:iron complex outermembrane receptor protein